jgi:integrase
MGTVFKKTFTKPLPAGAAVVVRKGRRVAEWRDAKGKRRTAPVTTGKNGCDRIAVTAGTYTAKYRDGSGIVREVATGCRDESAARSVLTELEKRAERVRGGILTTAEDAVIDHQATPLAEHIDAYVLKLEANGVSPVHRDNVRRALDRLAADCRLGRLADLGRESLERWLVAQAKAGMGARTRNTYRAAAVAFCNWCVETGRLLVNPFALVPKADEAADPRRQRRALTEAELVRLLDATRRRPLLEAMTVRRGKNRGQAVAKVRDSVRRDLERLGRERALIYKTLVLTGLRRGELASVAVGQLDLDGAFPCLALNAADEKNREGNTIPLRCDLAADLREWLAEKANAAQDRATIPFARGDGAPPAATKTLPADTPVFRVPRDLARILDRDLKLAGIPKRDDRGRTVDVHAMRHTFGTWLSKSGADPRTAQAAMRHSDVNLTMNVYTDPKLLNVAGAMEALPALPLDAEPDQAADTMEATGTDDLGCSHTSRLLAPMLAPKAGETGLSVTIPDKMAGSASASAFSDAVAVSAYPVNEKDPLTPAVNGSSKERETGFEPATSSLGSCALPVVSGNQQRLTTTGFPACTNACTSDRKTATPALSTTDQNTARDDHQANKGEGVAAADPLAVLAAALAVLSPGDRGRLVGLLTGEDER